MATLPDVVCRYGLPYDTEHNQRTVDSMDRNLRIEALRQAQSMIRALAPFAEVRWCNAIQSVVEGVHLGTTLDVTVNDICDADALPWLWTVVTDGDIDNSFDVEFPGLSTPMITTPYDMVVWAVYNPAQRWFHHETAVAYPPGDEPGAEEMAALYDAADMLGGEIDQIPGWRSSTIDAALEQWCAEQLDRPDLRFAEDTDAVPAFVDALVSRAVQAGDADRYAIAEGVFVTDDVFDELLAMDPDQAARITEILQELSDSGFRPTDTTPDDDERKS